MSEPEARLLHLFPGHALFLKGIGQPGHRSRLCEILWMDDQTFGQQIIAVTNGIYPILSKILGSEVKPGMPGEQLVFDKPVSVNGTIRVGDALFQVLAPPPQLQEISIPNASEFWCYELRLIEPGLIEPGAPVNSFP